MTIVEFLLARIAEDEAVAAGHMGAEYYTDGAWPEECTARVMADCKAKRRIVDLYEQHRSNRDARRSPLAREAEDARAAQDRRTQEARTRVAEEAALSLAAVYADHPDYDPEWALDTPESDVAHVA